MKLTRRGKVVATVGILLVVWAIWQVSGNLWWVGDGYCWGSMTECLLGGK